MTLGDYLYSLLWYEAVDLVWWALAACFGVNLFPAVFLVSIPFAFLMPVRR